MASDKKIVTRLGKPEYRDRREKHNHPIHCGLLSAIGI